MRKQRLSQKLQLNKIKIVGLSPIHAHSLRGGDGTEGTVLQPKPTVPAPVPQPKPKPEPVPTLTENSLAGGHDCTVMLTK